MDLIAVASRIAFLRPTKVPTSQFQIQASQVPTLYHACSILTEDVSKFFFEGWYGWGYYAAFDPEFVRRWYGPVVTQLRIKPGAKVCSASVDYASSPPGLLEAIVTNDFIQSPDKDISKALESMRRLKENPIQWVHGVDRLAIEYFDVVIYHDENVVVKNPDSVIVEGEFPAEKS